MIRKQNFIYNFSVEGETEKLYLTKLQHLINSDDSSLFKVKLDCTINKNPLSRIKMLSNSSVSIVQVFDYESSEAEHEALFLRTLDDMKKAQKEGKKVKFLLGYSNLTFELWILLHKANCNSSLSHRKNYLERLNDAFGVKFTSLNEYKKNANFNRILDQITLDDVRDAINRAERITQQLKDNGCKEYNHQGYKYYKDNPHTSLGVHIKEILERCKLI